MRSSKVVSFAHAASLINDEDIVTVSSSSGLGCPDAMLAAIGARFAEADHPRNLTMLHPIAAGDMYGIKGIDHLAKKGLIQTIIAGSFPSGPSSLPLPDIWHPITDNDIRAYNLPSGVLFDMHREVAAKRPGVLTKVGLDTYIDPDRQGGAMNAQAADYPIVDKVTLAGEEWLRYKNFVPRIAIVRATTADERGNLSFEHEGALLGGRDQALAVRNNGGIVIAQVKRVVKAGSLHMQQVHIPCNLVDYVVVDPEQKQTTQIAHDPEISGEVKLPESAFAFAGWHADKVIARRAALELAQNDAVNLGFGISANVPRILLEEGYRDDVTWVIEQAAVGGVPLLGFAFDAQATPTPSCLRPRNSFISRAAVSMYRCCRSCKWTASATSTCRSCRANRISRPDAAAFRLHRDRFARAAAPPSRSLAHRPHHSCCPSRMPSRCSRNATRLTGLFTISPVSAST